MSAFKAGDLVSIVVREPATTPPYNLPVGTVARIKAVHGSRGTTYYDIDLDPRALAHVRRYTEEETSVTDVRVDHVVETSGNQWNESWFDPAPAGAVFGEALIDWSGSKRATARDYAAALDSRVLEPDVRATLRAIAAGEVTTVIAANRAVTKALSSVATRFGQSAQRRTYTTMGRHLHYIVQGALTNALQGLPPIEPGARSPRIKALEKEVESLTARAETAERRADFAEEMQQVAHAQIEPARRRERHANEERKALRRKHSEDKAVLDFILGTLDLAQRERVAGFRAGWKAARS